MRQLNLSNASVFAEQEKHVWLSRVNENYRERRRARSRAGRSEIARVDGISARHRPVQSIPRGRWWT